MRVNECQNAAIANPYISVAIKAEGLKHLCRSILESLGSEGVNCEEASQDMHVSIAYAQGTTTVQDVQEVACEIAESGFHAKAQGFEILEGQSTPFDYLVLSLHADGQFVDAVERVEKLLAVREFAGGFKSHVSLLRFEKGSFGAFRAQDLVRELNASHGAAFALGRSLSVDGDCVCVYSEDRSPVCRVACQFAAAERVA